MHLSCLARDSGTSRDLLLSAAATEHRGFVTAEDGSTRPYDLAYLMEFLRSDPELRLEMDRAWCVSSLILLADRLAEDNYFDRAPVLEMMRHLRSGVAHGNRFTIRKPSELKTWPAHTRDAAIQSGQPFEITPDLAGTPILFDYMGVGDVLDVLISVGTHLLDLHQAGWVREGDQNCPAP